MGAAPCFGLTCEVRTGYGDELMTLHVMRVMELKGFESFRCPLKYAWPPQMSKGDILQHIEDLRTDFLPEQDRKERIPGNDHIGSPSEAEDEAEAEDDEDQGQGQGQGR